MAARTAPRHAGGAPRCAAARPLLAVVTLGIGWFAWALVVLGQGTTPAKSLLGQYFVVRATGERAGWGRSFVRQFVVAFGLGLVSTLTLWLLTLVDALMVFSSEHRHLTDRIPGTVVVERP